MNSWNAWIPIIYLFTAMIVYVFKLVDASKVTVNILNKTSLVE